MGTFVNVQKKPMADFLQGWYLMDLGPGVQELVYGKAFLKNGVHYTLRVYTAINQRTGKSRDNGEDAIRVLCWGKAENTSQVYYVGKSKHVKRTKNWRANLEQRIEQWHANIAGVCPACGAPLVLRENRQTKDKFTSCSQWPKTACKGKAA